MNMHSRRDIITILLMSTLSGCADIQRTTSVSEPNSEPADSDNDGIPDSKDDFPNNSEYSYLVDTDSETFRLKPGEFKLYSFEVNETSDLQYRVRTKHGSPVDVFITDEENFEKYEKRSKWQYYEQGSELSTTATTATFTVGTARKYFLIIDNTAEGSATPSSDTQSGTAVVRIDVELRRRA